MTNAQQAYTQMKAVYEQFAKDKYNSPPPLEGKGSVKAIHYIMSFADEENVSPELAHKIAKAFVRKTFGDDAQAVIATHVDKSHTHCHIILNSYSLSGQKFYANRASLRKIRENANGVCRAFGVKPALNFENKGRTMQYNEWQHKKNGTSWKQRIREEIDGLICNVNSLDELLQALEKRGYEIRHGKYISVKAPGQQRFVRTKTLGEEYTEESLKTRILYREVGAGTALAEGSQSKLKAAYAAVIGDVRILANQHKKVQRKKNYELPYSADNDFDVYRLSAQLSVINREKIGSIGELEGRISRLKADYEKEREEINYCIDQHNRMVSMLEQAEMYFELSAKGELSATEQLKLIICRQAVESNDIRTISDVDRLREHTEILDKKISALKQKLEGCKQRYEVYSDIAGTYAEISQCDYVEKLVREETERKEREQRKKKNLL
jgi:hypothetical protein